MVGVGISTSPAPALDHHRGGLDAYHMMPVCGSVVLFSGEEQLQSKPSKTKEMVICAAFVVYNIRVVQIVPLTEFILCQKVPHPCHIKVVLARVYSFSIVLYISTLCSGCASSSILST